MSQKTTAANPLREKFLEALRIPLDYPTADKVLQTRLVGLELARTCGRCGGSGSFSYNPKDGTRCYGCGGGGKVAQKLTATLLTEVRTAVEAGKLDTYLAERDRRVRLNRVAKTATAKVLDAWKASGVGAAYAWRNSSDKGSRDQFIANTFNNPMFHAHEAVTKVEREAFDFEIDEARAKTAEERQTARANRERTLEALEKLADEKVAEIKALTVRLTEWLAANPMQEEARTDGQ